MKFFLFILLSTALFASESKDSNNTNVDNVALEPNPNITNVYGWQINFSFTNKENRAENCVGTVITVPKGDWKRIKIIRSNKYLQDQGEAWCAVIGHVCKKKCVPLKIYEAAK